MSKSQSKLLGVLKNKAKDGTLVDLLKQSGVEIELIPTDNLPDDQAVLKFSPEFDLDKKVNVKLGGPSKAATLGVGISASDYGARLAAALHYMTTEGGVEASKEAGYKFLGLSEQRKAELLHSLNVDMGETVKNLEALQLKTLPPTVTGRDDGGDGGQPPSVDVPAGADLPGGGGDMFWDIGSPF